MRSSCAIDSYEKLEAVWIGVVLGMWAGDFLRSPAWTALVWISNGLFPLPAHAALGVLQDDASFKKLLPDLVGAREVFGLLRGGALLDHRFDLGVADGIGLD